MKSKRVAYLLASIASTLLLTSVLLDKYIAYSAIAFVVGVMLAIVSLIIGLKINYFSKE